jgi:hypothetical protein
MPNSPAENEFEAFFEEVWRLAEFAAVSEDRHLAPHLFALAEDIARENQPEGDAADPRVAGPDPQPVDVARGFRRATAATEHDVSSLDTMVERLARQRMLVSRMERTGDQAIVKLARQLLSLMQDTLEITQYRLAVCAAFGDRSRSVDG